MVAAEPDLGEPAAGNGGEEAVDGGDFTRGEACSRNGVAGEAAEEGGEPGGDAADGEGPHRHGGWWPAERKAGLRKRPVKLEAFSRLIRRVSAAANLGFADEEPEGEGDEDAGKRGDVERHAPAVAVAEDAAQKIAEGSADRDGDVENA